MTGKVNSNVFSFEKAKMERERRQKLTGFKSYLSELKDDEMQYEVGYLLTQFKQHRKDEDYFEMGLGIFDELEGRTQVAELKAKIGDLRHSIQKKMNHLNDNFQE